MKYTLVAYDENRAIGTHGSLPWAGVMKADMRRVRELTTSHAIIMGRKTYDSIGRALPNRQNIVVTHHPFSAPGVEVVASLEEAYAKILPDRNAVVFGGSQIYELALASVDRILATEIHTIFDEGDVFFLILDSSWQEVSREHHDSDAENAYPFDFVVYERR